MTRLWKNVDLLCMAVFPLLGYFFGYKTRFSQGPQNVLTCTLADTRLTGAVIRGGSFMSTLHQEHWWLQDLLTGRTFLGTTSPCWPWSWVRRMQTVHRLKRYNRQSRLRDLNSAIHTFLCTEWEAVLTEWLFWHQQANTAFYLLFMLLFTGWWEEQRLAIRCRVLLFQFISIPGIYLKLFLMCFCKSSVSSERLGG